MKTIKYRAIASPNWYYPWLSSLISQQIGTGYQFPFEEFYETFGTIAFSRMESLLFTHTIWGKTTLFWLCVFFMIKQFTRFVK